MNASQRELDQRRNAAFNTFNESLIVESLRATRVRRSRDRVTLGFADGSEALIHIASQKVGLATGEFQLFPTLIIYGGPVRTVIDSLNLDPGTMFADNRILVATLEASGGRQSVYNFRHSTDVERQSRRMSAEINRRFAPVITAFTGDYARAACWVLADPRWVVLPWCTALTLFELAGDGSGTADLLARAASDRTGFADLAQIPDPATVAAQIRRTVRVAVGSPSCLPVGPPSGI